MSLLSLILMPVSTTVLRMVLVGMRVAIGIIMMGHGIPKLSGGVQTWEAVGKMGMYPLGISFFIPMWGFIAACTETFGGLALVFGFGTRIACSILIIMMLIILNYHLTRGDSYPVYSHALALMVIFVAFLIIGGGDFSVDSYLTST